MAIQDVHDLLEYAQDHFTYSSDYSRTNKAESWCALPENLPDGFTLEDDCEGFAMFCRALAIKHLPQIETNLVICSVGGQGHCILRTLDPINDEELYLDNRYFHPQTLDDLVAEGYSFTMMSGPNPGDAYFRISVESN